MNRGTCAILLVALFGLFTIGCQSQPEVLPNSGNHLPTDPASIKFYQKEPIKYEVLGIVEVPVTGDVHWDENGDATAGFQKLRAAAAAQGANGILLSSKEAGIIQVLAGENGTFYSVPVRPGTPKVAFGWAIYVLKEQ
jgi:hypothetical protein